MEFKVISRNIFKETPENAIISLTINDLKRRLIEYRYIDDRFRKDYGMSFEDFKSKNMVKKKEYSFKVESDYCEWELAIDGIKTIEKELKKIMKNER